MLRPWDRQNDVLSLPWKSPPFIQVVTWSVYTKEIRKSRGMILLWLCAQNNVEGENTNISD
jgi:hypothetical protein